jgi:hypothetical protein
MPDTTPPDAPLTPAPDIAQPLPDPNTEPLALKQLFAEVGLFSSIPLARSEEETDSQVTAPLRRYPGLIITSPYVEEPYEILITHEEMTIGRAGSSDILLDYDPFTSRHHALLQQRNGEYSICDRRSAYGTTVNGHALTNDRSWTLQDGDQITIGQYQLIFCAVAKNRRDEVSISIAGKG